MKQVYARILCAILSALPFYCQADPDYPVRVGFLDDNKGVEISADKGTVNSKIYVVRDYIVERNGPPTVAHGWNVACDLRAGLKGRSDSMVRIAAGRPRDCDNSSPCKILGVLIEVFDNSSANQKLIGWGATSPETRNLIFADREFQTRKATTLAVTPSAPDEPISDQSGSVILIKTDQGRGTGFVCSMAGTNYIVTNVHVLEGAKEFEFRTLQNTLLQPIRLEIADDRDLARIAITNNSVVHLRIAPQDPTIGQKISVFGNSLGMGVVTYLPGTIRAIGANVIEVDAQFVSGNSGSPVVLNNDQTVGVATFIVKPGITNWVTAGTPFSETRRFAVRLQSSIDWKRVSVHQFYEETAILQDADRLLAETWAMSRVLQANRLDLLDEIATRQKGSDSRFHNPDLARAIASICDNIQAANIAYKKLRNENSSSVQIPLRSAKMTFQQLPMGMLQKIQNARWTTSYLRDQAKDYEKIFKDWK